MNWKERICYGVFGLLLLGAGIVFIIGASVGSHLLQAQPFPVQAQWATVVAMGAIGMITGFGGLYLMDHGLMGKRIGD